MASGGELAAKGRKKKKRDIGGSNSQSAAGPSNQVAGRWELGKKLSLSSTKSNAAMEKLVKGEEVGCEGS